MVLGIGRLHGCVDESGRRAGRQAVSLTALPQTTVTRVEGAPPSVTYTGTGWAEDIQGGSSRAWSGGTAQGSATAGDRATFTFTGTSVSWIGARGPQTGIARVILDGAQVAEIDTYAGVFEQVGGPILFIATGLAAGSHTLTIEVTGQKNAASSNTFILVDAFDIDP